MITRKQRNKLVKLAMKVSAAEVAHSWFGGADPNDTQELRANRLKAINQFNRFLDKITK